MPATTTINSLLDQRARETPDKWFLRFPDEDLTYGQFADRVERLAAGLATHGVGAMHQGSHGHWVIPALLPNCADGVSLWFAANRIGGVWAPINTEFRGAGLTHALRLTGSSDLVVDGRLVAQVGEAAADLEHVERLFVHGGTPELGTDGEPWSLHSLEELYLASAAAPPSPDPAPEDPSLLIYTSGTTGASKACELSHHYVLGQGRLLARSMDIRTEDVLFCPYPIFHWDAVIGTIIPALLLGATAVIAERFSVSRFWEDVRRYGVTVFDFMGATLSFLHKQDAKPDDADNPARLGWGVPMPGFKSDFEKRFGLTLVEGYGSTEGGIMVYQEPGEVYPEGSCGRAVPEYRLRIVDDEGHPLTAGSIGEIVVRPTDDRDRHLMMTGYWRMPEANAEAFRGGWFHTGDLGRLDEKGNLYFEGRKKDAIRRRGENISAFEVEQVIESHPAVLEAAAYGVPSEHTEEDVAVAVVLRAGEELTPAALRDYCEGRMARHMVPDHVRFLDRLPKTPTEKVAKATLEEWHRLGWPEA